MSQSICRANAISLQNRSQQFFICLILTLFSCAAFGDAIMTINGTDKKYRACTGQVITAFVTKSYQLSPQLRWKLYRENILSNNDVLIAEKTTNPPFRFNGTASTNIPFQAINGTYKVYVDPGSSEFFNEPEFTNRVEVSVKDNVWGNIPAFSINNILFNIGGSVGSPFAPTINDIYEVQSTDPINFNGNLSCGFKSDKFFISIQLSDINLKRYNHEALGWFDSNGNNPYGTIDNFNLKKFAEDKYFRFSPGQYYAVKLAFGGPWVETTRLIKIRDEIPACTVKISGPIFGNNRGTYTWKSSISNCTSPTYEWESSTDGSNFSFFGNSPSITTQLPQSQDLHLRLTITDALLMEAVDTWTTSNNDGDNCIKCKRKVID